MMRMPSLGDLVFGGGFAIVADKKSIESSFDIQRLYAVAVASRAVSFAIVIVIMFELVQS